MGSLGVGATDATGARKMIEEVRTRTERPFNVNVFAHRAPTEDPSRDAAWIDWMRPVFAQFSAEPPERLRVIYKCFVDDPDMLAMLLETCPPVVSFHFGLPVRRCHPGVEVGGDRTLGDRHEPRGSSTDRACRYRCPRRTGGRGRRTPRGLRPVGSRRCLGNAVSDPASGGDA
jgi:nitronate monooxygenase